MKIKQISSSLGRMTLAMIKMNVRNRELIFWTLLFPVFLMFLLGSVFGNGNSSFPVGIVDNDGSPEAKAIVESMKKIEAFEVFTGDKEKEMEQLKKGRRRVVIEIPAGFGETLRYSIGQKFMLPQGKTGTEVKPAVIRVYYDSTRAAASQLALASVREIVDKMGQKMVGYRAPFIAEEKPVKASSTRYIEFLVPGILAMMIMQSSLFGVALTIANWREKGILRRFLVTPMPRWVLAFARLVSGLMITMVQLVFLLLVAYFAYDVTLKGSVLALLALAVAGAMAFMAIGFMAASVVSKAEALEPVTNVINMPMMFLGGIFFPVDSAPGWLQPVIKAIPITYLSEGFREIILAGGGFAGLEKNFAIIGAWTVGALLIAVWRFRWE
ncbi:MAG: hypothetical protein PWQ91_988 [Eubacteriales bacterium]|nr:hypothetical protein [Eubacteriales bacterium]